MQEWDIYRSTKIDRGDLIIRIKNKTQKDWIKACERLGLVFLEGFGKGSHVAIYKPDCPPEERRCCITTLQKDLHSEIQRDIFKKVKTFGTVSKKYTEDDVWKALDVEI